MGMLYSYVPEYDSISSLVPRPLPVFQCSTPPVLQCMCNIEKLGVAWGRGYSISAVNTINMTMLVLRPELK